MFGRSPVTFYSVEVTDVAAASLRWRHKYTEEKSGEYFRELFVQTEKFEIDLARDGLKTRATCDHVFILIQVASSLRPHGEVSFLHSAAFAITCQGAQHFAGKAKRVI